MTKPSFGREKRKITITTTPEGIERAEISLKAYKFDSKTDFAKSQLLSRSVVTKFFECEPIQIDSFTRIREGLSLDWREIAGVTSEELALISDTNDDIEQIDRREIEIEEKQVVIAFHGDVNSVENLIILQSILREYAGYTIKINDFQVGNINLSIQVSEQDIEWLVYLLNSGQLTQINKFPTEDIKILSKRSNKAKWSLVEKIAKPFVTHRSFYLSDVKLKGIDLSDADLSNTDLSDADLSYADLSNADLSNANLSDVSLCNANLRGINLSGAKLWNAKLWFSDLSNADLSNVDLSNADLSYTDLSNANLSNTDLSNANLFDANLSSANLKGANLSGAILSDANLSNTKF
ncbi:pentapeptide repeat-containing protein [Nostoc piscinale]|uniref:pentapeptide repeat-containing protein n=1 Tax=Nostoc piscinale TaxID=224012 RepID=UPI000784C205|nr:pentapeptide repeat-containing protein [Nostoc piscinale]